MGGIEVRRLGTASWWRKGSLLQATGSSSPDLLLLSGWPGFPWPPACLVSGEKSLLWFLPCSSSQHVSWENVSALPRSLETPCTSVSFLGMRVLHGCLPQTPILSSESSTWRTCTPRDVEWFGYFPHLSLIANNKIKHHIATKPALLLKSSPFPFKQVCETHSLETNVFSAHEFRWWRMTLISLCATFSSLGN